MATLTPSQVYSLARKAGGSSEWAIKMAGVVGTESGGKTDAKQPGGMGRGLVQIDLGEHPDVLEAQAYDPGFAMQWALTATGGNPANVRAPLWYGPRDHPEVAAQWERDATKASKSGILDDLAGIFDPVHSQIVDKNLGPSATDAASAALVGALRAIFSVTLVQRLLLVAAGAGLAGIGVMFLAKDALVPSSVVKAVKKAVPK